METLLVLLLVLGIIAWAVNRLFPDPLRIVVLAILAIYLVYRLAGLL